MSNNIKEKSIQSTSEIVDSLMKDEAIASVPLIVSATKEDLAAVNISTESIALDKLCSDLDSLRSSPRGDQYGNEWVRKFNGTNGFETRHYTYRIEKEDNLIYFLGGTKGPECNNLTTNHKYLLRLAENYLNANTVTGKDAMLAMVN